MSFSVIPQEFLSKKAVIEMAVRRNHENLSKIRSRRLHLQELIAKRDRIAYEILALKKKISQDKKDIRKNNQILRERLNYQRESLNVPLELQEQIPELEDFILPDEEITIRKIEEEIQTIERFLQIPSFDMNES